jgi:hypothetical protein
MSEKDKNSPIQAHSGADNSAPYPVSRLAPGFSLVDLAKEIEQADTMLNTTAHARLRLIADQVLRLKEEARKVLEDTQRNQELHRAQCNFQKMPGKTYHLYKKPGGQLYFSMLSPNEWNNAPPHEFVGSYRLETDMSWKPAEDVQQDDTTISGLLDSL